MRKLIIFIISLIALNPDDTKTYYDLICFYVTRLAVGDIIALSILGCYIAAEY